MKRVRKNILSLIIVLMAATTTLSAQTTADKALEAYRNGNFKESIDLYESIAAQNLAENKESAEIYYNLGNAYYRDDQIAKSILNYERALLLEPGDSDIRHNLRFVRLRVEDKIDVAGNLLLSNLWRGAVNLFSSNTWAIVGIALFILLLGCVAVFLFVRTLWLKKTAFYVGIVLAVFTILSNSFAFSQRNARIHRNTAIVMAGSASIMASPDANSKELFRLHQGTKVKVNKTDGSWLEVEIANGSVGWTSSQNIEII